MSEDECVVQLPQPGGLILPCSRVERTIRKASGTKRIGSGVSTFVTAAVESVFNKIIAESELRRSVGKRAPKAIDRTHLVAAVRLNPLLARLFKNYAFTAPKTLKIRRDLLLNGADRDAEAKKRAEATAKRKAGKKVPAVDEE